MITGNVLTCDFAQSTGYAWGIPGEIPRFATHVFPSTGDNYGRHNANVRLWLRNTIFEINPVIIGYESPSLFSKTTPATMRKLSAYGGLCEEECLRENLNVPVREINPSTLKLFFAGHGKATKEQMMAAARRYGFKVANDDEADALAMWFYMVEQLGSLEQKRQFQQMQFEAGLGVAQKAKF